MYGDDSPPDFGTCECCGGVYVVSERITQVWLTLWEPQAGEEQPERCLLCMEDVDADCSD